MKSLRTMGKVFLPIFLLLSMVPVHSMDTPLLPGGKDEIELADLGGSSKESSPAKSDGTVDSETMLLGDEEEGREAAQKLMQDEGFLKKLAGKIAACGGCTKEKALAIVRTRAFKEVLAEATLASGVFGISLYAGETGISWSSLLSTVFGHVGHVIIAKREFLKKFIPCSLLGGLTAAGFVLEPSKRWFLANYLFFFGSLDVHALGYDLAVAFGNGGSEEQSIKEVK